MTTINKHTFHGIYSNFGYKPNLDLNKLWADTPIHTERAFFVANDPEDPEGKKPLEFQNEESALKWYKKSKYSESFVELNFPEDFCKNYFTFPEEDFYKYKDYFHGINEFASIKFNYKVAYEGSYQSLKDCECSSSSSSSEPPVSLGLSMQDILDVFSKIINEPITILNEEENCCYCPPCYLEDESEIQDYNCQGNFNLNVEASIDYDSSKIFEISEFEKRFAAQNLTRSFEPSYDEGAEETHDKLQSAENTSLYKDNWVIDSDWKKPFLDAKSKFSNNATYINDPVILYNKCESTNGSYNGSFGCSSSKVSHTISLNPSALTPKNSVKENLETQKEKKESQNFGNYSLEINAENSLLNSFLLSFNIFLGSIIYLKSEKKYMCFINLNILVNESASFYINRSKSKDDQYENIANQNDFKLQALFTTDDSYKIQEEKYETCPDGSKTGIKFKKEDIQIKLGANTVTIQVHTPENKEFSYSKDKNEVSITSCDSYDIFPNCDKLNFTKKWEFSPPTIKLTPWEKIDFDPKNIYPQKIS